MKLGSSILKCGHRGACGYAPENTRASFQKAIDMGVDGFEFDIQLSKDGHPVVIHDDTLDRTTSGKGLVKDFTLRELKELDAGMGKGERQEILTLEEVIDLTDKRCKLFIELKAEHSVHPVVEQVMHAVMHKGWRYEQLFVISFDHNQIAAARELCEHIHTSAIIVGIPVTLAQIAQEAGAWSINPGHNHLTQALVNDAHKRGLRVLTWTVNNRRDLHKVLSMGVDGVFGDFPDILLG